MSKEIIGDDYPTYEDYVNEFHKAKDANVIENTDTLEHDGSHLTIRNDLVEDGLSVPVHFLDYKEDVHIEQTDTLNIDCIFSTDGEELYEGMGIIVRITDPTKKDKYGEPWKDRMAFAYSIDFDWN